MSNTTQIIKIDDNSFRDFYGRFNIIKDPSIKSLRIIPTNPNESLTLEELTRIDTYIKENSLSPGESGSGNTGGGNTGGSGTLPNNVVTTDMLGTYEEFISSFEDGLNT